MLKGFNDSYQIMMKCWEAAPDDRPSFKELHKVTSKYTEHIAGYLELGFNPFAGIGVQTASKKNESFANDEEDEVECTVSIQVIPPSVDTSEAHTNNTD